MTDRLAYRVEEVAAAVGVDNETVRRWLEKGRIPGRKVGGLWLIPIEGLRNWLHEGQEENGRRGFDLPTPIGRALGGDDQQGSERQSPGGDEVPPHQVRGRRSTRRATKPRRATERADADGWRLPRALGS